jgi:8-oxo-dGTP pyrophosphatase MutT (NUDIX family)
MLKQSSAGIVVYRIGDDNIRTYLLLQYPGKYWDFPKGKLEKDEKWIEAALREAKEESGLSLDIEPGFEHCYTYNFNDFKGNKIEKTVIFFIGKADESSMVILSYEHIDYLWLPFEQARMQIHFESVRELLDEVEAFLNKKYKIS